MKDKHNTYIRQNKWSIAYFKSSMFNCYLTCIFLFFVLYDKTQRALMTGTIWKVRISHTQGELINWLKHENWKTNGDHLEKSTRGVFNDIFRISWRQNRYGHSRCSKYIHQSNKKKNKTLVHRLATPFSSGCQRIDLWSCYSSHFAGFL